MEADGKGVPWWSALVGMAGLGAVASLYSVFKDRDRKGPEASLQRIADSMKMTEEIICEILESAAERGAGKRAFKGVARSCTEVAALAFVHAVVRETHKDLDVVKKEHEDRVAKCRSLDGKVLAMRFQRGRSLEILEECMECAAKKRRVPATLANQIAHQVVEIKASLKNDAEDGYRAPEEEG
jgi:hypothetical protein